MSYGILCRAKRLSDKKWVYGYHIHLAKSTYCFTDEEPDDNYYDYIVWSSITDWGLPNKIEYEPVDVNTVGLFSGYYDKHRKDIYCGDIVEIDFNGYIFRGVVTFRYGAFGIVPLDEQVNYDKIIKQFPKCKLSNKYCFNPSFISLYELAMNGEDDLMETHNFESIQVIGNKWDIVEER